MTFICHLAVSPQRKYAVLQTPVCFEIPGRLELLGAS